MKPEPSKTLASRSYVGLVLSQFLAAFNDQAIHFVAIFYASDMLVRFVHVEGVDHKLVLALVTACFISPFFFFSPLAGILADKYSKRTTIVFWKVAEVGITGLALVAFLLPHTASLGWGTPETLATISAVLLIVCVFLMGTHSAFFVPAKYGIMPEILHTSVLSRGNGLLEGTSFVSQILGTSFGGILYTELKSDIEVDSLHPGHEWIIGAILLGLAVVGVLFSLLVARVPAAAPQKKLTLNPLSPMAANFRELRHSRSLVLATVGIAFFTFMTLYMRQSLIFEGELAKERQLMLAQQADRAASAYSNGSLESIESADGESVATAEPVIPISTGAMSKAQESELKISLLVALIGLGVGIGCTIAGQVSGNRLELGLVPVGALLLVLLTLALAGFVGRPAVTIVCLIAIGMSAGLYIVPMYTLLQHRAPKASKGSMVATSNFLNVTGGLLAVVVFYFVTYSLQAVFGLTLTSADAERDPALLEEYISQLATAQRIPPALFVSASVITALVLGTLCWQRPDFLLRALSWLRIPARRRLKAVYLDRLPATGAALLATNCSRLEQWMHVVAVVDRFLRFVPPSPTMGDDVLLANASRKLDVSLERVPGVGGANEERLLSAAERTLKDGNLVGLYVGDGKLGEEQAELFQQLQARMPCPVIPVYCGEYPEQEPGTKAIVGRMSVELGEPMAAGTSIAEVHAAIERLGR
jgi:acyl-[acyl-carrier-protein]-phospholipid O-acyltransferase/long-chain-fatty-acid--[acyl-carrier-protein] ligase